MPLDPALVGQIQLLPLAFTPQSWLPCQGQSLQSAQYSALYSVLGNAFGGDSDAFNVPNLTQTDPQGCNYFIGSDGPLSTNYQGIIGETILIPAKSQGSPNLLPCDGRLYSSTQYELLFTYLGNRFGNSGQTTSLPNLKAPLPDYNYMIVVEGATPMSPAPRQTMLGELILLPYSDRYQTLVPCDGSWLYVEQNQALFSVIGTTFGGSKAGGPGAETFNVPDLSPIQPPGYTYMISLDGTPPTQS